MPTTAKPKTGSPSGADPSAPLCWPDLVSIKDDYGIQLNAGQPADVGEDAEVLHAIYRDWVHQSGTDSTRRYVMPLSTVYMWLRDRYGFLPRHEAGHEARRVLVDGLNDPHSGFAVVLTPSSALRSRR